MVEHFLPVSSGLWFTVPEPTPDVSKFENVYQFPSQKSVVRILDRFDIQWNNLDYCTFPLPPMQLSGKLFCKKLWALYSCSSWKGSVCVGSGPITFYQSNNSVDKSRILQQKASILFEYI